jgi:hypothetical protein
MGRRVGARKKRCAGLRKKRHRRWRCDRRDAPGVGVRVVSLTFGWHEGYWAFVGWPGKLIFSLPLLIAANHVYYGVATP